MKVLIVALTTTLVLWAPSAFAEQSSSACKLRIGKARPVGCAPFRSQVLEPERKRAPSKAVGPSVPDADWMKDIRAPQRRANQKRSQRLLIQELTHLERLLSHTRPNSPDRAGIIRRLAEGYAELERLAGFERRLAEARAMHQQQRKKRDAKARRKP